MNTIPTLFNEKKVAHTIIGGIQQTEEAVSSLYTIVLLNRGGRYYRSAVFQNFENAGIKSVISIEMSSDTYDLENLSLRYPFVKFLVPLEKITIGEMINISVEEIKTPYFLVIWNDIKMTASSVTDRFLKKVSDEDLLCGTPLLATSKFEQLPIQMVPGLYKNTLQVEPMSCFKDLSPTIYPFDFVGFYHKEKFISLGGFDHSITNPYWQNLDFGFRAFLWGERILISTSFRLVYEGEVPLENITTDESYSQFYLKNLAPVCQQDKITLPFSRLFAFISRSGKNLFDSIILFLNAKKWIDMNHRKFIKDAASLVSEWEPYYQ